MQVANALYTYAECTLCNCAKCAKILNTKWPARSLQQGSILLKPKTRVCVETMLRTSIVGWARYEGSQCPPKNHCPFPSSASLRRVRVNGLTLTGCVMLIRERMAQSKGEDWSEPVRLCSADAPVSTPTLAYEHPWLPCSNNSDTY
jgi:hypothetical protein